MIKFNTRQNYPTICEFLVDQMLPEQNRKTIELLERMEQIRPVDLKCVEEWSVR